MSDRLAGMNKEMRESTLTSKEWAKEIDSLSPPLQRAAKQLKGANGEVDAFKGGLKGLKGVLSNVGNMLINAAIGSLVSLAIIGLEKLWNYWEDQKSYLKQLQTEYETLKGKVEALNTEYDTNSKRIEELIALKSGNGITKSQQEELDLLNKQNEALELQILRQERLAQLAADKVRIQAEKTLSGASYNVFNTGDEGWDAFFSKVAGGAADAEFALTGYAAQINKITSEINELNDAYANGGISEAEYTRELQRLKAEQDNWAAKSESLITDVESQISGLSDNDPLRVKYQELIDTLLEVTATYDKLRSAAGEFDPSKAKAELVSRFGGQGYISRSTFNNSLNKLSDEQLKFVVSIAPTITNREDFLAAMRDVLDGGDSVVAQKYIEWQAIADKNAIKAKLEIDGSFADEVKKNLATLGSGADGILATSNLQALEKSGIGKDKIQAIGNLRILVNDLGYSWSAFVAAIKETEFALDDVKDAGISTISFLKAALNSTTSDTDLLRQSITALENDVADFDALFAADENGEREYFDALISKFPQIRGELELYSNGLISAEQLSKAFKSALAASDINALSDAFKNIRAAVEAYGADSYEAKQATEAVADTLPGLNGKLVDAAGNYTVLGEAAITAANGNVDAAKSLIEAEIAAQKLNLQHAIDEMGRVAKAAYGAKIAMGIMRAEMADMNSFGETGSSGVNNAKSVIAELEEMLDGLNSGKYKVDYGSSKSSGSSTDAYLEKYKQDLADIQFLRDMDYISEKEYHDKLRALNDERLKGRNKYLDEYRANLVALHNYDVKLFEEAKDAQVDALEKEKDALEDYYNDLIDAKKKETEAYKKAEKDKYEAAKKRYENEKKLLQKELDGKKKAIQKQLDLLSDQSDEKSHEEEVAESNKRIADIRSKIEEKSLDDSAKGKAERLALEEELVKETSALEKSQYDWSVKTQRGALEKQMDQLEEYYDKLMENIDNALDHLEETFDVWLDNFETSIDSAIEDLTAKMEAAIASIDSQIQSVKSQTMAVSAPTAGTGGTGGDNSSEIVKQLQSLLQNNGFSVGKQGVDGKLGKDTIKALQRYLNSAIGSGLKIDGIIGSATTAAINDAINKRILSSMFSVITSSSFPKYHTGGIVGAGNKKDMDLLGQIVPIDRKEVLAKLMKNEAVLTEGQQTGLGNIVTNLMGIISRQNGVMRPALAGAYNANTSPTFNVTYNVSGDVSKTTIADLEATQKKFADYAINQLSNNVRRTLNRYGK
jgi:peptidoglycan hydrolase-like protein with peptidoglycan-binding domain